MNTAGIICEYNPLHNGHVLHIAETKRALGGDCAIICVMSGNTVQRGGFAVYNKHARAESAVLSGADLVIELPAPYSLSSAERFARAGVFLLASTGVCDVISFGSESGDIGGLSLAAAALDSKNAAGLTAEYMSRGLPYATARQAALEAVSPDIADLLKSPNNLLGIEYLRAVRAFGLELFPVTIRRTGAGHDSASGCSSSALRIMLERGADVCEYIPRAALEVYMREHMAERGPVFAGAFDTAILARLRALPAEAFGRLPDATEGLGNRLMRYARSEPSVARICEKTKTKRYAMSRIRRMVMCSALGITAGDTSGPPPYIRVLAANSAGRSLIRKMSRHASLPIITKPAASRTLGTAVSALFEKESAVTDFYVLAYSGENARRGGAEWTTGPRML